MKKNTFVTKVQKGRKPFCAIDHIQAINIFREALKGDSFTIDDLKKTLRDGGIPSNTVFINTLCKTPMLTQVSKNQFKFSNPKQPVYYRLLDKVYKDYLVKTRTYRQTYREKRQQVLTEAKSIV